MNLFGTVSKLVTRSTLDKDAFAARAEVAPKRASEIATFMLGKAELKKPETVADSHL
jgi:hypothetical protein